MDRVCDSDSQGRWFESSRAYQSLPLLLAVGFVLYCFCNKKGVLTFLISTPLFSYAFRFFPFRPFGSSIVPNFFASAINSARNASMIPTAVSAISFVTEV